MQGHLSGVCVNAFGFQLTTFSHMFRSGVSPKQNSQWDVHLDKIQMHMTSDMVGRTFVAMQRG